MFGLSSHISDIDFCMEHAEGMSKKSMLHISYLWAHYQCLGLHCRRMDKNCLTDHVLLIDYLLSFQYFRIFRWSYGNQAMLDVHNDECMQRILNPELVCEYLHGLQAVLGSKLFAIAHYVLEAQISAGWINKEYEQQDDSVKHSDQKLYLGLHIAKLQLLLRNKLDAERSRNTYLGSIADRERNDVFNETDRIVSNLLDVRTESGEGQLVCNCCFH